MRWASAQQERPAPLLSPGLFLKLDAAWIPLLQQQ
jgi:hypothetical protein